MPDPTPLTPEARLAALRLAGEVAQRHYFDNEPHDGPACGQGDPCDAAVLADLILHQWPTDAARQPAPEAGRIAGIVMTAAGPNATVEWPATPEADDRPADCPGEDCPMCSGEVCSQVHLTGDRCEHAVDERHHTTDANACPHGHFGGYVCPECGDAALAPATPEANAPFPDGSLLPQPCERCEATAYVDEDGLCVSCSAPATPEATPDTAAHLAWLRDGDRLARALHDGLPCAHDGFHRFRHLDDAADILAALEAVCPTHLHLAGGERDHRCAECGHDLRALCHEHATPETTPTTQEVTPHG